MRRAHKTHHNKAATAGRAIHHLATPSRAGDLRRARQPQDLHRAAPLGASERCPHVAASLRDANYGTGMVAPVRENITWKTPGSVPSHRRGGLGCSELAVARKGDPLSFVEQNTHATRPPQSCGSWLPPKTRSPARAKPSESRSEIHQLSRPPPDNQSETA